MPQRSQTQAWEVTQALICDGATGEDKVYERCWPVYVAVDGAADAQACQGPGPHYSTRNRTGHLEGLERKAHQLRQASLRDSGPAQTKTL